MRRRWWVAGVVAVIVVLLYSCSGGPQPPRLEDLPPGADGDDDGFGAAMEVIVGTVVGERLEHGEPVDAGGGRQQVLQSVIVSIAVSDREAEIELIVPVDYVDYPPPDTGESPLNLPRREFQFRVQERTDGRYQCASPVCILEP